jgi:hypothetical protein
MAGSTHHDDSTKPKGEDLRSSPRHEFPYVQKIAPMAGGKVPSADKFFPVRCKDLSCGGIAMLLDRPPDFELFMIVLGSPPTPRLLTARVVHCEPFEEDGWTRYRVGCRFISRVQR